MRNRNDAPLTAQALQATAANQRAAASRPKRSKRPVSDKPMPPRSGVSRPKLELGKLRKAVSMRQERGIPINAKKWAQAVAMILASKKGKPTGADLAWWCRWAGIEPPRDVGLMMAFTEWPKWKCRKWRARLGALMDLDPTERDDLSWWLPITPDETPEEATSRRKRRQAAERRQDARLAAEHEASLERDRKLRAGRKRQQRRDEGRPTREERAARAQADRDEAARCGVTPAAIRQRRWRARLSQSCPLGPPHPLPDVTVASTRGLYGVPKAPAPAQVRKRGFQRGSVLLPPRLNPHRLSVRPPPVPPMRSTGTRLSLPVCEVGC